MYCKKCGQQIDDDAVVCVHCGTATDKFTATTTPVVQHKESNVLAIVGFIFSFYIAIVGLICSIIGYRKAKQEGLEYGGLALAGIIISAVSMAIAFIWLIIVCAVLNASISYYMFI